MIIKKMVRFSKEVEVEFDEEVEIEIDEKDYPKSIQDNYYKNPANEFQVKSNMSAAFSYLTNMMDKLNLSVQETERVANALRELADKWENKGKNNAKPE